MAYSTSPGYIGPGELWRRFMAGFTVTHEQLLDDGSEWVVRPMTRYHVERLNAMTVVRIREDISRPTRNGDGR